MTIPGDDTDEMFRRHHLDDVTIDRILSGRAVTGENELVSFVEDVHIATTGTPVPTAALLGVFAEGLSHVKGDLSATTASNVTGPELQAAGLPQRKKKNMLEIALAKLASAALVAKLGVAAGAMTLAGTAAAATGTLPDPAQDFASDAAARAGITIPASEGRQDAEHRQDADRRQDAENRKDADEVTEGEAPENYGTSVSDSAKSGAPQEDGRTFGETTASNAPKAPQATEAPTADDNPGTDARSEAPAPEQTPTAEENPGSDASGEAQDDTPTADDNPGTSRRP